MANISSSLALVIVALSIFTHPVPPESMSTLNTTDLSRGQKIFVAHCALCHGIGATGGRGPALNRAELRRASDDQAMFRVIQNGIEGTEMPGAWQLSNNEIKDLVEYVRSLARNDAVKLTGDPARGKTYYEGKGACTTCHIVDGRGGSLGPDLTNIGARRSASYLREALIDPGAAVPEDFLVVSLVTKDGRRIRGMRANEDSFTIQLRDSSGAFHSVRKSDLSELKKEFNSSLMPGYRELLSSSEIDDMVAFLAGLRGQR
ncbi:MAG TPA: c-type cytochrome [Blastocatellia bacterium]|nr:c-type cytochrome [Blastocatellia bacterium]